MVQQDSGASTTPLLASAEEAPTSLTTSQAVYEDEPSDFSRLIALAHNNNNPLTKLAARYDPEHYARQQQEQATTTAGSSSTSLSRYLVSVTAGTLCALHLGFVLTSLFVADSYWTENYLNVQLRFLPLETVPLPSTGLATLLQQLNAASQTWAAMALWTTSLIIPCVFIVVAPSWIVANLRTKKTAWLQASSTSALRLVLELSVRWALSAVFVVATLALACHFVAIQWTGTALSLQTESGPGLASFTVGVVCAISMVILLRWKEHPAVAGTNNNINNRDSSEAEDASASDSLVPSNMLGAVRTPPPHAFRQRIFRRAANDPSHHDENAESPSLQILEDEPPVTPHHHSTVGADLPSESSSPNHDNDHQTNKPPKPLSFLQLFIVFQVGLLSVLLVVPALAMPAIEFKFSGLASEFMETRTQTVYLYEIPGLLCGDAASTNWWIGMLLSVPTALCPAVATLWSALTWMRADAHRRSTCQNRLYTIHPAVGGIVASIALLAAIHVIEPWSDHSFNNDSSDNNRRGICDALESAVGELCLTVSARAKSGMWCFVFQSVLLEIFIVLTLLWS